MALRKSYKVHHGEPLPIIFDYEGELEEVVARVANDPIGNDIVADFHVELEGNTCKLALDTGVLPEAERATYYYDVYRWKNGRPIECLLYGQLLVVGGISDVKA